jgi:hypothetical protein
MLRIKNIQLHNYGPAQHTVGFDQKSVTLSIPRSQHALFVHATLIFLKIFALLLSICFLKFESILWRTIAGFFIGFILSEIVLFSTHTKSTVTFLFTPSLLIRSAIWLIIIMSSSYFQLHPLNIVTSENMYGIVTFIFIFDTFLAQFLNFVSKKQCNTPILRQHPLIQSYLEKKYQFGYDMPVLTVLYPVFKWFLG